MSAVLPDYAAGSILAQKRSRRAVKQKRGSVSKRKNRLTRRTFRDIARINKKSTGKADLQKTAKQCPNKKAPAKPESPVKTPRRQSLNEPRAHASPKKRVSPTYDYAYSHPLAQTSAKKRVSPTYDCEYSHPRAHASPKKHISPTYDYAYSRSHAHTSAKEHISPTSTYAYSRSNVSNGTRPADLPLCILAPRAHTSAKKRRYIFRAARQKDLTFSGKYDIIKWSNVRSRADVADTRSCLRFRNAASADMAELADALDLGSSGQPCRFDPCYPHQKRNRLSA